jgi:protein required for attachment to host cells
MSMGLFKRMRISGKIFFGVSCFIFLGAAITGFAAYNLYVLANSTQHVTHHAAAAVVRSVAADQRLSRIHRSAYYVSDLNPDVARRSRERFDDERTKLADDLVALKPLLDADDMALYQKVLLGVGRYDAMYQHLLVLAAARQQNEFNKAWDESAIPIFQSVEATFYELVQNNENRVVREVDAAHATAQSTLTLVVSSALIGTLLILAIGFFLVKREIVSPLVGITKAISVWLKEIWARPPRRAIATMKSAI